MKIALMCPEQRVNSGYSGTKWTDWNRGVRIAEESWGAFKSELHYDIFHTLLCDFQPLIILSFIQWQPSRKCQGYKT